MKFTPPPLELANIVKGEYFTLLDVVCPTCSALPGDRCVTVRCGCAKGYCSPGNHRAGHTALETHLPRRIMWERWTEELESTGALRRVEVPFGFPSVGQFYRGSGQGYCALLVVKSVSLQESKAARRRRSA